MSVETEIYEELFQDDKVYPETYPLCKSCSPVHIKDTIKSAILGSCSSLRVRPWSVLAGVSTLLVLVIVSLVICIIVQTQIYTCEEYSPMKHIFPSEEQAQVTNTREYQILLADLPKWVPRRERAQEWTESTILISAYLKDLSITDMKNYSRIQYTVDATSCNNKQLFRVRNYLDHPAYNTTIDIKESTHDHMEACSYPFWPGFDVFDGSFQKCEKDLHRCNHKFSRETRVTFANVTTFDTCADLVHLYPYAFNNIPYERLWTPVSRSGKDQYWWMGKFVGKMNDTDFEIEITLQYDTLHDLLTEDHAPTYGEWSIRIFTLDDGLSKEWDQDVVSDANNLWLSLGGIYGNDDQPGEC